MTCLSVFFLPEAIASSWNPSLLVSTEAFQVIDDQDTSSDVYIQFGDTIAKSLTYDRTAARFSFDDDLYVSGSITASGVTLNQDTDNVTLAIDSEATTAAAVQIDALGDSNSPHLLFGENGVFDTNLFRSAANVLKTDDSFIVNGSLGIGTDTPETELEVRGTISGSTLTASNINTAGEVLYSDGSVIQQTGGGSSGQLLIQQDANTPLWKDPTTSMTWYIDADLEIGAQQGPIVTMPFGMTITGIDLKAKGAPTGSSIQIDINEDGASLFTTRPEIDIGSTTEDGNEVLVVTPLLDKGDEITVDLDQVGSTFAGSGLTIMLHGIRKW